MANEVKITVTGEDKVDFTSARNKSKVFTDGVKEDMKKTNEEAVRLQTNIDQVTAKIGKSSKAVDELRRKVAEAGTDDAKLFGDLAKEEAKLKQLTKLHDAFVKDLNTKTVTDLGDKAGEEGAEAGGKFGLSFVQKAGPLVARAGGPYVLAGVAAVMPAVVLAVGTAISLGAAAGAVTLGAVISAKDPRVASSLAALQTNIGIQLKESAKPFVPAMLSAIDKVNDGFKSIRPELDNVFAKTSTYLDPLVQGAIGFVRNALPGFSELVDSAENLVEILGDELPELGEDFGEALKSVANFARDNEDQFRTMLDVIGLMVRASGELVENFNKLSPVAFVADQIIDAFDDGEESIGRWVEPIEDISESFATATDATRSFREEMDKLINNQLDAEQASLRWQEAIDAATESANKNGNTLDENTEKGRANRKALLDQARAGLAYADAIYEEKAALGDVAGAEAAAETAYRRSRDALVASARQMGLSKREAEAYVTSVLGIPPTRNTRADFIPDNKGVSGWKKTLSGIPHEIFTSARLRAIVDVEVRREQATEATGRAHGGLIGAAASGGLRANRILVGESGREIVDLPPGSRVHSNPDTERMLSHSAGGQQTQIMVSAAPGAEREWVQWMLDKLLFTVNNDYSFRQSLLSNN